MSGEDISSAVVGNMEEDDDRPPEENALVIYDSDEEPDDFTQVPVESPFLVQLVARAKKIIEYDLLTSNIVFPYEDFEALYQDLRTYLPQIHERLTRDAVWKSVVNWLVIIKQSLEEHTGLKKDERFHLILINFVASYIHYKCMTYAERNHRPDAHKVTSEIHTTLDLLYRVPNEVNYILMALLKVNLKNYIFNAHYASVINPVFKKYLCNRKLHQSTNLISYVRLVLCYKKWKKLAHTKEEKEAINTFATGNNAEGAENSDGVLPQKIPKLKDNIHFARIFPKFSLAKEIERKEGKNCGSRVLLRDDSTDLDRMIRQFFKHYRNLLIVNLPLEETPQQPSLLDASDPGNLVRSSVQTSTIDKHLSNTCDIVNKELCDVNSIEILSISDDEIEEQRTSFKSMSIGEKQGSEISQKCNSKAPSNISNCRIVENIVLSDDEDEISEPQPCPSQTLPEMPSSNLQSSQIENSSSSQVGMCVEIPSLHNKISSEINEFSRDDRLNSIANSSSTISEGTDLNSDLVNSFDKLLRTEVKIDEHVKLSCVDLLGSKNQIEVSHMPSVGVDGESFSKNLELLCISKSDDEASKSRNEKSTNFEKTEHDKCNKNSFGVRKIPLKKRNSVLRESSTEKLIPVSENLTNDCILLDELNNEHKSGTTSETRSLVDSQCAEDFLKSEFTATVSGSNVLDNERLLAHQEKEEMTKTNVSEVITLQMDKDVKKLNVNSNKMTLETEELAKTTVTGVSEIISQKIDEVEPRQVNLEEGSLKSIEEAETAEHRALEIVKQKMSEEVKNHEVHFSKLSLKSVEEDEAIVAQKLEEEVKHHEVNVKEVSLKSREKNKTINASSAEIVAQRLEEEVKHHEVNVKEVSLISREKNKTIKASFSEMVGQRLEEEVKQHEVNVKEASLKSRGRDKTIKGSSAEIVVQRLEEEVKHHEVNVEETSLKSRGKDKTIKTSSAEIVVQRLEESVKHHEVNAKEVSLISREKNKTIKASFSEMVAHRLEEEVKHHEVNVKEASLKSRGRDKTIKGSSAEIVVQRLEEEVKHHEVNVEKTSLKSRGKDKTIKGSSAEIVGQRLEEEVKHHEVNAKEVSLISREKNKTIKASFSEMVAQRLEEEVKHHEVNVEEARLKSRGKDKTIKTSSAEIVFQRLEEEVKHHEVNVEEARLKSRGKDKTIKTSSAGIVPQKLDEVSPKSGQEKVTSKKELLNKNSNEVNLKSADIAVHSDPHVLVVEPPINDLGVSDRQLTLTDHREEHFSCTNSEEAHNKAVVQHKSNSSSEEAVINDLFKFNSHNIETAQISPKKVETVTDTYNFDETDAKTPIKWRFKRKYSQESKLDKPNGNQSSLVLSTNCTFATESDSKQDDNDISALLERIDEALNDEVIPADPQIGRDNGESHSQKPITKAKLKNRIQNRLSGIQKSKDSNCTMSGIETTTNDVDDNDQEIIASSTRLKNSIKIDVNTNDLSNKVKVVNNCKLNDECLRTFDCKTMEYGSNQQPENKLEQENQNFTKPATKSDIIPATTISKNSTVIASVRSCSTFINNRKKPIQRKPTINLNTAETRTCQNTNLRTSEKILTIENRTENEIDGNTSRPIPEQSCKTKDETKLIEDLQNGAEYSDIINKNEERNVLMKETITPGKPCPLKKRALVEEVIPLKSPTKTKENSTRDEMGKIKENFLEKNVCSQNNVTTKLGTTATEEDLPKSVKQILMRRSSGIYKGLANENATVKQTLPIETTNQIKEVEKNEEMAEHVEPEKVIFSKLKSCLVSAASLSKNKRKITFSEENIQQTKKNVILEENHVTQRENVKIDEVKEEVIYVTAPLKTGRSKTASKGIAKVNKGKQNHVLLSKIIPEKEKIPEVKILEKNNLVIENSCGSEKEVSTQNIAFLEKLETSESNNIQKSPKQNEDKESKTASIQSPNKDNDKNNFLSHSIDKILGECKIETSSSEPKYIKGDISNETIATTKKHMFSRTQDIFLKSETKVLLHRVSFRKNKLSGKLEYVLGNNQKPQLQTTENNEKLQNSFPEHTKLADELKSVSEVKNNVQQIKTVKTENKVNNISPCSIEAQNVHKQSLELNLMNIDTKPTKSLLQGSIGEQNNSDNREQQKWMKQLGLRKIDGETVTVETNSSVITNPPVALHNLNLLAVTAGLQERPKPKSKRKTTRKNNGTEMWEGKRSTRNSCSEIDKQEVVFFNELAKQTYAKGGSARLGEADDGDKKCKVKKRKSNAQTSSSKQFVQQSCKKPQQRKANNKRVNNVEKGQVTDATTLIVNDDKITLAQQVQILENRFPQPSIPYDSISKNSDKENSIIQIKTSSEPIKPIPEEGQHAKPQIDLESKIDVLPLIDKETTSKNNSETNLCLPESLMNHSVEQQLSSDETVRNNQTADETIQTDKPQNSKAPHSSQEKSHVQKKSINRNRMTLDDVCRTLWEQRANANDAFSLEKHEEKKEPETCKIRSTARFSKENENPNFDKCDEKESSETNKAEVPGHVSKLKTQPRRICKNLKTDGEELASQKVDAERTEFQEQGEIITSTPLGLREMKSENVSRKSSVEETPELISVYKVISTVNNEILPADLSVHKTIDDKMEAIPDFENTTERENGEIYESHLKRADCPKILTDVEIAFNSEEIIETTNTTDICFKQETSTVELHPNTDCAVADNKLKVDNLKTPDVLSDAKSDIEMKNANAICKENSESNADDILNSKTNNICEIEIKQEKELDDKIFSKPASKQNTKSSSLNATNIHKVNVKCNKDSKVVKNRAKLKNPLTKLALEEILNITPSLPEEIFDVQDNEKHDDDNTLDCCVIAPSGTKRSLSEQVPTDPFNPPLKKQKLDTGDVFELENTEMDGMNLLNEPIETLDHIDEKSFSLECDDNSTSLDNLDNSEDLNPELSIFSPDEMFDYYMNSLTDNCSSVLNDDGMSFDYMISARNYGKNAGSSGSTFIKNSLPPSVTFEPEVEYGTPPIVPLASTMFKEVSPDDGIGSVLDPNEFLPNDELEKLYESIVKGNDKKDEVISFDEYDYASEIIIENGKSPKKDDNTTDGLSSVEVSPVLDEQPTSNTSPSTSSQSTSNSDSAHVTPTNTIDSSPESIPQIVTKANEVLAKKNPIHDITSMNSFPNPPVTSSALHSVPKCEIKFPKSVPMDAITDKDNGMAKRQQQSVVHKRHHPYPQQKLPTDVNKPKKSAIESYCWATISKREPSLFDEVRSAPPPATVRPVIKQYIKTGSKIKSYEQTEINNRTNQGKVQKVYLAPNPSRARVPSKKMSEAIIFTISAAASNSSAVPLAKQPRIGPSWGPQDKKSTEEILQDLRKQNGKVT